MFSYYKEARICYAYLSDIASSQAEKLTTSRWFKRGWTLQELIAPQIVEFYASDWIDIGTKKSLRCSISRRTGIPQDVLLGADPKSCNIAERMSWACDRRTTRVEDLAYSLMGIFDVNMPMLYGEGMKAFQRLQREIFNQRVDYSIFAWSERGLFRSGFFADSPHDFGTCQSQQGRPGCLPHSQEALSLPSSFSMVHIDDYRKITPVNLYDHISTTITRGRALEDPPMFTSSGLRLRALVSKSYTYARFIFLGLEYEGGYLCILEKNGIRLDPGCIFRCDHTELRKMKHEYLYFDTARTQRTFLWGFGGGVIDCEPTEFVQLLYQQPQQNYKRPEIQESRLRWDRTLLLDSLGKCAGALWIILSQSPFMNQCVSRLTVKDLNPPVQDCAVWVSEVLEEARALLRSGGLAA
ncbi:hypothetical protein IQ07DRAFT_603840 [Pyrenochaeta sp. DS3sAY3a]|nr:hypothetical protein IQ07DRAFT_603840 [Pyrenochaeta sp. DS3sAY3a]